MADQLNYSGATIFWLYIVAALAFTTLVLHTIISIPTRPSISPQDARPPFRLFSLLALTSFTILSTNMLHVLIHSFNSWSPLHPSLPLSPTSSPSISLLSPLLSSFPSILPRVYRWSTTSTLFHDFAAALVATPARTVWTQSALLVTLLQSFEMALHGRENGVPRLGAFFALAQILPISFAQNLLYLAVLRRRAAAGASKGKDSGARGGGGGGGRGGREVGARVSAGWTTVVTAAYAFTLMQAPLVAMQRGKFGGTDGLIWTILGARVLLVLPLFLARTGREREEGGVGRRWVGRSILSLGLFTFMLQHGRFLLLEKYSLFKVGSALFEHPAVTTLGMDLVLSVISSGTWSRAQGDRETMGKDE